MTLNKYNEYMSHIEVTDEMKARVLANVSKAIEEQKGGASVTPVVTPITAKKRHVPIIPIISIAATVLIVGGIALVFVLNYLGSSSSPKHSHSKKSDDTAAVAYQADGAAGDAYDSDGAEWDSEAGYDSYDDEDEDISEETLGTTADAGEAETFPSDPKTKVPMTDGDDIYALIPITNVETSMTEENGTRIIVLNGDENNAVIYIANDGTDLASLYLGGQDAGTESYTSNMANGVTDGGINYALFNTVDPDSSTYNAATFAFEGNTYLIVLDNPVPEENIREFISEY